MRRRTIRISLNEDEHAIIEEALSFYRQANIDVAEPVSDDQFPTALDVLKLEARLAR